MNRRIFAIILTVSVTAAAALAADGGGSFVCEGLNNAQPAPASFRLLRGDQEIAKGQCGPATAVPAGDYEALIVLDGALDMPVRREAVRVAHGQTNKVKASFETGELLVEVTREGRRSVGVVRLSRDGKLLASVGAGSTSRLTTATYGVEIESRGVKRPSEAVTIVRGERRVLVVDFSEPAGKSSQ